MLKREKFIPPSRDEVFTWKFLVPARRDEAFIWSSHWSEVPHELISCKYLTRTTFRNVILKLAFNQWRIKP